MGTPEISLSRVALTTLGGGTCINPIVTSVPNIIVHSNGTGCILGVSSSGTIYNSVSIVNGGNGYMVGDILKVGGSGLNGTNGANSLTAIVRSVNPFTGTIYTISDVAGTAATAFAVLHVPAFSGSNANLTVGITNNKYSATIVSGGTNFAKGNLLMVPGLLLGGSSPDNDMTCTVLSTGNGSTISSVFSTQITNNIFLFTNVATGGNTGTGLTLDITYDIQADTYSAVINNPGDANYSTNTVTVLQSLIGRQAGTGFTLVVYISVVNNAVMTVTGINNASNPHNHPLYFYNIAATCNNGNSVVLDLMIGYNGSSITITPNIVTQTGTNWSSSDFLLIPSASISQVGPIIDFTIMPTQTDIVTLANFSNNAINDYSKMRFNLPTSSFRNVVYMDWVNAFGLKMPVFVNIEEFTKSNMTTGKSSYWRYINPNTTNDFPDRMAVRLLTPTTYTNFTVSLVDSNGRPITQLTNWTIELIVYSQV